MSTPAPLFQSAVTPAPTGPAQAGNTRVEPSIFDSVCPLDIVIAVKVERQLDRIDVEAVDDLDEIETHLRLVERVIGEAEEDLGKPVGMAETQIERRAEKVVSELYRYRRLVRSRRGQLMDRVRQQGSSPRQRALRRLADEYPQRYRELVREERAKVAEPA